MAAVQLRNFAAAREAAGKSSDAFDAGTIAELLLAAAQRYGPQWQAVLDSSRVWLNGDEPVMGRATSLRDGDEVAVLPPVSGGSDV